MRSAGETCGDEGVSLLCVEGSDLAEDLPIAAVSDEGGDLLANPRLQLRHVSSTDSNPSGREELDGSRRWRDEPVSEVGHGESTDVRLVVIAVAVGAEGEGGHDAQGIIMSRLFQSLYARALCIKYVAIDWFC